MGGGGHKEGYGPGSRGTGGPEGSSPATMGTLGIWAPLPLSAPPSISLAPKLASSGVKALAQMKENKPLCSILIWRMKVYIKQLLIGSSSSLYLQGPLFHSAGKFLPTMTAFEEPARL